MSSAGGNKSKTSDSISTDSVLPLVGVAAKGSLSASPPVCTENLNPDVVVMKSAKDCA